MAIFDLILKDKLTAAARSALDAVNRLDAGVGRLADSLSSRLSRALGDSRGRMRDMGGRFTTSFFDGALGAARRGTRGLMSALGLDALNRRVTFGDVAGGALAAAGALGAVGAAIGRNVIELASFRESSLAALETVMGSGDAAQRTFANAITVANQTPLDTRDVVQSFQRFAVAGFSERELAPLVAATADIGAAFGRTASDSFSLVVSQMRAAGKMDRGDLRQLLNSGVNTGEVLDSIARQMGITGANDRARRQRVLDAISKGRVTGEVGIQASLDATRNRLDRGDVLGTFAKRQSETLTGALSNAANAWDNLLLSFGSERLPGVVAFRDAVLSVTGALDGSKPAGAALRGLVSDVVNVLGTRLGSAFSEDNVSGFASALEFARPIVVDLLTGLVDFGEGIGSGFTGILGPVMEALQAWGDDGPDAGNTIRDVGRAFGFLAGAAVIGVGVFAEGISGLVAIVDGFRDLPDSLSYLADEFDRIATEMVDGFLNGLNARWERVTARVTELSDGVVRTVRNALDIKSPSRVMMELGGYTAEGFAMGVDGGRGRVGRSLGDLVGGGAAGAVGAAAAGRAAPAQISVQVLVQAPPGGDPEEAGRAAGRGFVAELAGVFELLNLAPAPAPAGPR